MFPGSNMMMTGAPPLPPEIQSQQAQSPVPMFNAMGMAGPALPDPVAVAEGLVNQIEELTGQLNIQVAQINPGLGTLLVPIAQAGQALRSEFQSLRERTAGPSPMVTGSVPPNVPGNIPGARPAM